MSTLLEDRPTGTVEDLGSAAPGPDGGTDAATPPPGWPARAAAGMAVLAAVAAAVSALFGLGDTSSLPRGAVAVVAEGAVELAADGGWRTLGPGDPVPAGGRLRAVDAVVTLDVTDGRLELLRGTHTTLGPGTAELERGSLLVDGGEHEVTVDALTASGNGTWRVDDGGRPRVASYAGEVTVSDGVDDVTVGGLRQMQVRDGALGAAGVQPLRYLAADPFDAVQLAEAFRIDELTESLGRSLASTHGDVPRELAFYRAFVAVGSDVAAQLRDAAPKVDGERFGPPADVLLTVVVIDAIAVATDRTPSSATETVVPLRRDGATWGLVALDAGIDAAAVSDAAERALVRADADPPPPPPDPEPGPATDDADAPPAPAPAPGGTDPPDGAPPTAPPPGGGEPSPEPDDDTDGGGPLRPVEDLLRGTGSALGDAVEGTTDTLGDVVGGVDELLQPGGLLGR